MTGRPNLLDRASVGALFGVSANAVAMWQKRYADGEAYEPFPEPDFDCGARRLPVWLPEREGEIRAWHAAKPSQGRPGQPKPGSGRRRQAE